MSPSNHLQFPCCHCCEVIKSIVVPWTWIVEMFGFAFGSLKALVDLHIWDESLNSCLADWNWNFHTLSKYFQSDPHTYTSRKFGVKISHRRLFQQTTRKVIDCLAPSWRMGNIFLDCFTKGQSLQCLALGSDLGFLPLSVWGHWPHRSLDLQWTVPLSH